MPARGALAQHGTEAVVEVAQVGRPAGAADTMAVRRVADDPAGAGGQHEVADGALHRSDVVADASTHRVLAHRGDRAGIAIGGDDRRALLHHVAVGAAQQAFPAVGLERRPPLERERAVAAGRHPPRDHRGLDGDGAGTAERVDERRAHVPPAGQHQGSCQRLAHRRLARRAAPASVVQRRARRVEADGDRVAQHAHLHHLTTERTAEHLVHPFFDRTGVVQLRLLVGGHRDGDAAVGQPRRPVDGAQAHLQRVEPVGVEASDAHDHSSGDARAEVDRPQLRPGEVALHPAAHRARRAHAQLLHFVEQQRFQTGNGHHERIDTCTHRVILIT